MKTFEHNTGCIPDFKYKFKKIGHAFFMVGAASYIKQIEEDCFDKEGNCVGKYRTGAKYMRDFWGVSDYLDKKMDTWSWDFQVNYEIYNVSINICTSGLFSGGYGVVGKKIINKIINEFFPGTTNHEYWQTPNYFQTKYDLLLVEKVYSYFPGHGIYRYVDLSSLSLSKILKYCKDKLGDEWVPNYHNLLDYFGKDFQNNIDKIPNILITKLSNYGN